MLRLTRDDARAVLLAAQGLTIPPAAPASKEDILPTIRRMNALQIDSIQVVARSAYVVLWSRLGAFDPDWLDRLLDEGKLFEYWAHAMCFIPIEDFPLYRRRMLDETQRSRAWLAEHPELVAHILETVRERGGARTADWGSAERVPNSWWSWKPEKLALECLFDTGDLMVARRERFQRVYDLRERVLPGWDDRNALLQNEAISTYALKALRALGVAKARWVPEYFQRKRTGIDAVLSRLEAEGRVVRVAVEGWDVPGWVHPDNLPLAEEAARGGLRSSVTILLSPFDPIVCNRERAEDLFDFSYRIECYTPAHKRRYGYFTMPILHRGALVGRLDPKAHRKDGVLEIRSLHLEPGVEWTADLREALDTTLRDFAAWQGLSSHSVSAGFS